MSQLNTSKNVPSRAYNKVNRHDIIISDEAKPSAKEVERVHYIFDVLLAIVAEVTAHYICKWLDSKYKG